MMTNRRWMKTVLKSAAQSEVAPPWQRGPRRVAAIALRRKAAEARRTARS